MQEDSDDDDEESSEFLFAPSATLCSDVLTSIIDAGSISHAPSVEQNFVFGSDTLALGGTPYQHPPRIMVMGLCDIFLRNVDLPFKILHAPTLHAYMNNQAPYLQYPPGHPAVEAISFGVYLAAVISLTADQCFRSFGISRDSLCRTYRIALEHALAQANFITTRDVTVLQAFVLYLSKENSCLVEEGH